MSLNISTELTKIGLTQNEATVYTYIFNNPDLTASEVSKKCMIDKSSTYRACEDLAKKGILITSPQKRGLTYRALSPNSLVSIIEEQEVELNKRKTILEEVLKNINIEQNKDTQIFVEYGEDALEKRMLETLETKEKITYQLLHKFSNLYRSDRHRKFNQYYVPERKKRNIKLLLLEDLAPGMTTEQEKKKEVFNKEIRLIPKEFTFKHSIIIYDNTTILQTFTENEEIIVITIKDKYTTEMFKSIFMYIWGQAQLI